MQSNKLFERFCRGAAPVPIYKMRLDVWLLFGYFVVLALVLCSRVFIVISLCAYALFMDLSFVFLEGNFFFGTIDRREQRGPWLCECLVHQWIPTAEAIHRRTGSHCSINSRLLADGFWTKHHACRYADQFVLIYFHPSLVIRSSFFLSSSVPTFIPLYL